MNCGWHKNVYCRSLLINEAHAIAFLVYGASKANAAYEVLEGERDFETYPAQLIIPEEGMVNWFLDEDAAKNLSSIA